MKFLWEIFEDEEGDSLLIGTKINKKIYQMRRSLFSDADRGRRYLHDMINGHSQQCHNMLRMWPTIFTKLCNDLESQYGLCDTLNISAKESVAMFLHMCGHNITQRTAMRIFGHSSETISRKFYEVLDVVVLMRVDMFKPNQPMLTQVHPKITTDKRYWPYFRGFVGAIDGTHVPIMVSGREQKRYWNRHGKKTMNILEIYDIDMKFTYIYVGIPGSAHDAKVLSLDMEGDHNFSHPPDGKYYLGDLGYALRRGFLCLYRGDRYHPDRFRNQQRERNHRDMFNHRHSSLRSVIERTFGVWKGKWRVVRDEARYNISTMRKIIVAIMTLHNFIRKSNIEDSDFQNEQHNENQQNLDEDEFISTEEQDISSRQYMEGVRDEIARGLWNNRR